MVGSLLSYSVAAVLVVLLPGPDTMVVIRNLVRGGRRQATRTVLGVLTGLSAWVAGATLGLSAMLRASHDAYLALRIVGACYLVWMGVQSLRSRGEVPRLGETGRAGLLGEGYRAGLLTDLLNPKVGVFFVTFLPGFVSRGDAVGWSLLLFGAIFIALTAAYFTVLLVASAPVTRWLATPRVRRRMDRWTGLVLVGFGVRLALEP